MACNTVHDQYLISYHFYLVIRNLFHPEITPEEAAQQLNLDISCIYREYNPDSAGTRRDECLVGDSRRQVLVDGDKDIEVV